MRAAALAARLRDPLVERDYVRLCARPSSFRNRFLAALAAGVIVLLVYGAGAGEAANEELGPAVHLAFTWAAALLALQVAGSEAAVALPTERATGTLPILLTVPMSSRRLAAGFLVSRLLFALTALLALLPIEGLALLLGGVSGRDLLLSLAAVGTAAVYGAAVGMLGGRGAATHRVALGRAAAIGLFHAALLPALFGMAAWILSLRWEEGHPAVERVIEGLGWAAGGAFFSTPFGPLVRISMGFAGVPGAPVSDAWFFGGPAAAAGVLWVWAFLATGRRLLAEDESGAVAGPPPGARAAPAPRKRGSGGVWRWPLLWKESRPERVPWKRWALRVVVGALFAVLCWLFLDPGVRREFERPPDGFVYDFLVALPVWLMALAFLPLSATLVAEEREGQSLDLLRATPIPPVEYLLARPVGLLWKAWPFLAAMGLLTLLAILGGLVHWLTPVAWLAGSVLVLPALALIGFRLGLNAPTVRAANRRAGSVLLGLLVGYPFLVGFLAALFRLRSDSALAFTLHPFVALMSPMLLLIEVHNPDYEFLRFCVFGLVGGVAWFSAGLLLWRLLPGMVRDAFHGKGAG